MMRDARSWQPLPGSAGYVIEHMNTNGDQNMTDLDETRAVLAEIPAGGISVLIAVQDWWTTTTSVLIDLGVKRTTAWLRVPTPVVQRDVQLELSGVHVEN
jgi:hypothetical protein